MVQNCPSDLFCCVLFRIKTTFTGPCHNAKVTIVARKGDYSRQKRKRRPKTVAGKKAAAIASAIAVFGDYSRQCGLGFRTPRYNVIWPYITHTGNIVNKFIFDHHSLAPSSDPLYPSASDSICDFWLFINSFAYLLTYLLLTYLYTDLSRQ